VTSSIDIDFVRRRFFDMPIYEYQCKNCGKVFEVFQGMTDSPVKTCRFCQGPVKRLISMSTFHLKGSGWYATDYGGKKAPAAEIPKEETGTSSAVSEAGKTESPSDSAATDKP
jgi:putative FmdB family regulatory protein